jgi:DNA transposition AAA+ family ATPase
MISAADDTNAIAEEESFIVTKEYRRFSEFCDACLREKYIGLCYGSPGVGKTLSARHYTKWYFLEHRLPNYMPYLPLPPQIITCRTVLYTAEIINTPRMVKSKIEEMRVMLSRFVHEVESDKSLIFGLPPDRCELIIVDEAERLKISSIEQLREIYDSGGIGMILIGMPGLEKRLARYPQLYSRIGFAHAYKSLSQEEMRFLLERYWQQLGLSVNPKDYTDAEAIAAIIRVTSGNFRLVNRLFKQIERVLTINRIGAI